MKKEKEKMKERETFHPSILGNTQRKYIELISFVSSLAFHFYHVWNASDEAVHARAHTHTHTLCASQNQHELD